MVRLFSPTRQVSIYINDINDHKPSFVDPLYKVTISEGTPPGTSILRVKAIDPDASADILYTIDEESK